MSAKRGQIEGPDDLYSYLIGRAYHLLSIRPRSEKELLSRLTILAEKKRQSPSVETLDNVIEALKKARLVDDAKFAEWLVASRSRGHIRGKLFIANELRRFGVSREIITAVLEATLNSQRELDQAKRTLEKYIPRPGLLPAQDFRRRSFAYLTRKGFTTETVREVIDEFMKKKYNTRK